VRGATTTPAAPPARIDPAALATADDVDGIVAALQERLRDEPADAGSWATLGLAYVEQARLTGDPTYYPKAAGALTRSLREQPDHNALALAGRAALAAARHDFDAALVSAQAALRINPYELGALAIRADALTELGRYGAARQALDQADQWRPGLQVFARYSYARELQGRTGEAGALLERALSSASVPADRAYLLALLADLDRSAGRLAAAGARLDEALRADPDNLAALASRARLAVARGDLVDAERRWRDLVRRTPLPEYVLALGELLETAGRPAQARRQYDVLEATATLARGSGVTPISRPRATRPTTARVSARCGPRGRRGPTRPASGPPTRTPGRCTRSAGTPPRCGSPATRPGSAPGMRCCGSTAAASRPPSTGPSRRRTCGRAWPTTPGCHRGRPGRPAACSRR